MNDEVSPTSQRLVELTADVVAAYISNNQLSTSALPEVISSVYATISMLGKAAAEPEKPVPAVPIKRSVTPEYLISLEDGRQYKSLKRHLGRLGMTPEEYRTKWKLPDDYPMVAPNYAERRSTLAKAIGLGTDGNRGRK